MTLTAGKRDDHQSRKTNVQSELVTELISDPLEAGREAARRLAWREAYEHLSGADTNGNLTGEDLANLGEAAYWTGRLEEAIAFRERAVAAYIAEGEPRRAAVLAAMLSIDQLMRGAEAVSSGWLGRAERLLADEEEGPEHGFVAFAGALKALMMGDMETAVPELGRATSLPRASATAASRRWRSCSRGRSWSCQGRSRRGSRCSTRQRRPR